LVGTSGQVLKRQPEYFFGREICASDRWIAHRGRWYPLAVMGIGISLNPADVFKIFSERAGRRHTQIATWVEEVAVEARQLADTWKSTDIAPLEATKRGPEERKRIVKELQATYSEFAPNQPHFSRLRAFYQGASSVLGGRTDVSVFSQISNAMGSILLERDKALHSYNEFMRESDLSGLALINTENSPNDLRNLTRIAGVLDREAAALEVLAKNLKATA
jgi:hypothetical protein